MKRLFIVLIILGVLAVVAIVAINMRVGSYSAGRIYDDVESVSAGNGIAIILGARVEGDGTASNTLYDRVVTGVDLYKAGKTPTLFMSGGNREPAVMKKLAVELGVPEADIFTDELGTRTYESCSRAKQVFEIDRAIVVTQDYHLPRSLYLCRSFGVDSIGVNAKRRDYLGERYAWLREYLSRVRAWYDINFRPRSPGSGEQPAIDP